MTSKGDKFDRAIRPTFLRNSIKVHACLLSCGQSHIDTGEFEFHSGDPTICDKVCQ
jgi:hypothetical protein